MEIKNIMEVIKCYDKELHEHCVRTGILAERIGFYLVQGTTLLRYAGWVHDIGKIFVDQRILNKRELLNREERLFVDLHSVFGYTYLKFNHIDLDICEMVLLHHGKNKEKYGYTYKEQNAYFAEILRAADIIDALTSPRSYHEPICIDEAFTILKNLSEPLPLPVLHAVCLTLECNS